MTDKTLREKIAEGMYERMNPASKFLSCGELDVGGNARKVWETEAQAILAIPEIKEGLELLGKAKSGKLVELKPNQRVRTMRGLGRPNESAPVVPTVQNGGVLLEGDATIAPAQPEPPQERTQ